MRILLLSAEVAPFAKVGGLADVAGSLPKALQRLGHDIRVLMPRYGTIDRTGLTEATPSFPVLAGANNRHATLLRGDLDGVTIDFLENEHFFGSRRKIYGEPDEREQFAFFCRAALDGLRALNWRPDVIHSNDWHTALTGPLLRTVFAQDPFFRGIASVFTIHNLAYQGIFARELLDFLHLPAALFNPEGLEFYGMVNCLKGGIVFSDRFNTVSERYAQEIQTPEYGEKLDGVIKSQAWKLWGILNGLDTEVWDPAHDPKLPVNFSVDHQQGKADCKRALQQEMNLPLSEAPLFGVVSRLVSQKGFDLLAQVAPQLLREGGQLVILGSGDPALERFYQDLDAQYPDCSVRIGFDAALADRIYAGSDFFLMPSRFEPCGLGQMIALRYGTIPVVRETGGLADTIREWENGQGNGFTFCPYEPEAFLGAIRRGIATYRSSAFPALREKAMREDFSWGKSAGKYLQLYEEAFEQANRTHAA